MGASFDWSREVITADHEYYKWTQWIFLKFFEKGLAYQAETPVNWCPKDKTVLANEQVVGGKCERCGSEVIQRNMKQWMLKITDYAEKLLAGLEKLNWKEEIKEAQRNWIGKSEGAIVRFPISNSRFLIEVFTTRPDTLFGATYIVLAPEHPLISNLKPLFFNFKEVEKYISEAKTKTQLQRQKEEKEKTGVELKGIKVINPANNEEIPIWIAEYVLMGYGTGAIMAVPAHDERDFEFAKKFKLPIVDRPLVDKDEIVKKVGGKKVIQYRLRDWVVSRQRYWGAPIPIIHCPKDGAVAAPEKDLPVLLPEIKDYLPTGEGKSPLAKAAKWLKVRCPKCGGEAERETDTLDTFVDSSWYFLRYCDPKNEKEFAENTKMKNWMPVDLYSGGAEHTTMHLLYSRFFYKAMYDCGLLGGLTAKLKDEPYVERRNRGIILGPDRQKMSKSKDNVIAPGEYVEKLGADTVRMYLAFIGPYNEVGSYPWNPQAILGIKRFLDRAWNLAPSDVSQKIGIARLLNKTIKKVGEDIERFRFNTAISALMILLNKFEKYGVEHAAYSDFLKLLAPFAPHLTEEIWNKLGNKTSIHVEPWPKYDPKLIEENSFELIVQVNGKVRDKFEVPINISKEEAERLTLAREKVKSILGNKKPGKIIFVPKRLINFVI